MVNLNIQAAITLLLSCSKTLSFSPTSSRCLTHQHYRTSTVNGRSDSKYNGKQNDIIVYYPRGNNIYHNTSSREIRSQYNNMFIMAAVNRNHHESEKSRDKQEVINLPLKSYNDYLEKMQELAFLSTVQVQNQEQQSLFAKSNKLTLEAQSIFDKMFHEWYDNEKDDLEPTTEIYNLLIDIYSNNNNNQSNYKNPMGVPEQILHRMEHGAMDNVPKPNIETYVIIMNGWSRLGNIDKVEQTLYRLEQRFTQTRDNDVLPNIEVYNTMISACLKSGAKQKAEEMLLKLMNKGVILHDNRTNDDKEEAGHDEVLLLNSFPGPDTKTFYLVMNCFIRDSSLSASKKASKINTILEAMKEWKLNNPDTDVDPKHKNVMNVLIKASLSSVEAETFLFDMIDTYQKDHIESHRPDAASFINTINVWKFSRSNEAAQRSSQLLELLNELYEVEIRAGKNVADIKPDRRVYSAVQTVWCRSKEKNKAKEAKKLLLKLISLQKENDDLDYAPKLRQWNNVLNACVYTKGTQQKRKEAMKILVETFNEMRNSDDMSIQPNHVTYGMFLKACATLLQPNEQTQSIVENVFRKCCRDGHVSDFVFTALVEVASPELFRKLLGGDIHDEIEIPEGWARNVPISNL